VRQAKTGRLRLTLELVMSMDEELRQGPHPRPRSLPAVGAAVVVTMKPRHSLFLKATRTVNDRTNKGAWNTVTVAFLTF